MTHKIIDNFLPEDNFLSIQKGILRNLDFPWFMGNGVAYEDDGHNYFVHEFYKHHAPVSEHIKILLPLLEKLDAPSLIRVKANMYIQGKEVVEHGMHRDNAYKHNGFILYLNTCNGYTKLEDGTKVDSVENRALFFDSYKPHCSTGCTDQLYRANININYFEAVK